MRMCIANVSEFDRNIFIHFPVDHIKSKIWNFRIDIKLVLNFKSEGADFNKNFQGRTIILPDFAQNAFGDFIGSWLQSKNQAREELVKMDNPDFEKEFVVYSNDQIEARYILSTRFHF